jgi:DNA-binding response OmpR family regulator
VEGKPMPATVVLICETTSAFITSLEKQYTTIRTRSGKQGLSAANEHSAQIIILDAISMGTHGDRISKSLKEHLPDVPLIHCHPGPKTKANSHADIVLYSPLTARTLINTIEHRISQRDKDLLKAGIFALDVERRILLVDGHEVVLTPTQVSIVKLFLSHPNEVLEREWLIKNIWDTSYTGDTRILSVHIRHVREILEANASKPQYLKTIRGKGYQLEIPLE